MAEPSTKPQPLRAAQDPNAFAALGRAVSYMMTKPAFANAPFGHWAKTLTGQINRKHYFFVTRGDKVAGFVGWAFVDEAKARLWVEGKADIGFGDSVNGDCVVINAWASDDEGVNRFILEEMRRRVLARKRVFAKRFYKDGRVRPVILELNDILKSHVTKTAGKPVPA
jgi:hemolysin-activating ACP:hemolysin acyltransferase